MIKTLYELSMIAIKAGIIEGDCFSDVIKNLISGAFDMGAGGGRDALWNYLETCHNKIGAILQVNHLKELHIPESAIPFLRAEMAQFLSEIDSSEHLAKDYDYRPDKLLFYLWEQYRAKNKYPEYEEEIRKILYEISAKAVELATDNKNFITDSLLDIMSALKQMDSTLCKIGKKLEITSSGSECQELPAPLSIKSRYIEYLNKWKENLFLNDFDDDDPSGTNLKLSELYILPHYRLYSKNIELENLDLRLTNFLIEDVQPKKRMLLILGQPGIGKSTLITWLANQSELLKKEGRLHKQVYIYRFTDFKNLDWKQEGLVNILLKLVSQPAHDSATIQKYIVVLDGFDEINIKEDYSKILNQIYIDLCNIEPKFVLNLIITCRENYIENNSFIPCTYLVLNAWNTYLITDFYNKYKFKMQEFTSDSELNQILQRKEILGIPLILYMLLALNIKLTEENSIADIYDQIFSLNGGIYDRYVQREKRLYWGEGVHRIAERKADIHTASQKLAMWMFENNPEESSVPEKEYEKIISELDRKNYPDLIPDLLIGNYFKMVRHCEGAGTANLYFIHRSIYEYFVADTIFNAVKMAGENLDSDFDKRLASNLFPLLKSGMLSKETCSYTLHKIKGLAIYRSNKEHFSSVIERTFWNAINHGMFCNVSLKEHARCFVNILGLFEGLIEKESIFSDFMPSQKDSQSTDNELANLKLEIYNAANAQQRLNLSRLCLRSVKLPHIPLTGALLIKADLSGSDLKKADLSRATLLKANLKNADLRGANLGHADLRGAILDHALLLGADLSHCNLTEASLNNAVLTGANLANSDLSRAAFRNAALSHCNLTQANLTETNLTGAQMNGTTIKNTIFDKTRLSLFSLSNLELNRIDQRKIILTEPV